MLLKETKGRQRFDLLLAAMAILLLVATAGFAAFYYFDRYVSTDDTLVERQIEQFAQAIQGNPADPEARVSIAEWYLRNDMIDEAIEQGNEALKLDAGNQAALMVLGQAYLVKHDATAAIATFERIVALNRDNEFAMIDRRMNQVYYRLGELYLERGEYGKAAEALHEAIAVDPTDADANYLLAVTYQSMGDHTAAIVTFEEALRFVPNFPEAYAGLRDSYRSLNKAGEALYATAMLEYARGEYGAAATKLEEAAKIAPSFAAIDLGLGLVYEQLGKSDAALTALHRYIKTNPDSVVAQQTMGRLAANGASRP